MKMANTNWTTPQHIFKYKCRGSNKDPIKSYRSPLSA